MNNLGGVLALAIVLAAPALGVAQTLPPSTQDRQAIADLTYQANLPGTSAADRAAIQRRIIELQYQINTRAPIAPLPAVSPSWGQSVTSGELPKVDPSATQVPLGPTVYGSCDADHAVIAYLDQQVQLPTTTRNERNYDLNQRAELQKDLHARGC